MKKRIAIFHNYLDNIGGAERVTLILARELAADIYTTVVNREMVKKIGFDDLNIKTIGWIPVNAPLRQQLAQIRFRKLNLKNKYDFYIIAGDWALAGAVNNQPNLWYVYSPPRELWDLYRYTRKNTVSWWGRWLFDGWVYYNRFLSKKYIGKTGSLVAISRNVQGRVKKYLCREAGVIYPPTETKSFYYNGNGDFWLSVNRLINHKRVDIQVKAFAQMPKEKLIIVGSYEQSRHFKQYANYIKSIKPSNVILKHWVSDEELKRLYAHCKGFITTAYDEDYGLTPVEAMASGKPVIAPREGGYSETIVHNKTGWLLDEVTVDCLIAAVKIVGDAPNRFKEAAIIQARQFDVSIFLNSMKKEMNRIAGKKLYEV